MPPRPLVDFAAAVGFLTLLPFGRSWPDERPPRAVGWYPWVGWVLGLLACAPLAAIAWLSSDAPSATRSLLLASLVVAGWALTTRFLHWDGLADAFDGLWGGRDVQSRLEIMRDSRIGSFGAAAMIVVAFLQVTAAAENVAAGRLWALLAAPVLARFAASASAWSLPAARREGLGLTAMERPRPYDVSVATGALVALLAFLTLADPVRGAVVMLVALASAFVVPRVLARPVGGMTGDLFGATVLMVETVVLLTGAVV